MRRALLALLISGCVRERGDVSVVFEWQDPPPEDLAGLYLHATVEERTDLDRSGRVLAADAVPLIDAALSLLHIPDGKQRVVIAEVREGPSRSESRVLYRGLSEPFDTKPGVKVTARVRLHLERVPSLAMMDAVRVKEANAAHFVTTPQIHVEVRAAPIAELAIARDAAFTVDLLAVEAVAKGPCSTACDYEVEYSLCAPERCADGPATLYVRATDALGYVSDAVAVPLELDLTDPDLIDVAPALLLIPAPNNALVEVSAIGADTTARLTFITSELVQTPTVAAIDAQGTAMFPFELETGEGTTFVFDARLPSDPTILDGEYDVAIELTDRSGRRSSRIVDLGPALLVDRSPPAAPDELALLYHRVPWGSEGSSGVPAFWISAPDDSVEDGSTVIAYDGVDVARASEIGRTTSSTSGAVRELLLSRFDRDDVFVSVVDGAGNQSDADSDSPGVQATRVSTTRWTATLRGKIAGRPSPNPHRVTLTGALSPSLDQEAVLAREPGQTEYDQIAANTGDPAMVGGRRRWREHDSTRIDDEAIGGPASLAWDGARGRLVLFGGQSVSNTSDRVWEWIDGAWVDASPSGFRPSGGVRPNWAYAGRAGAAVLFGNAVAGANVPDTLLWDGAAWRAATGPGPRYRSLAAIAYDERRGKLVLFGGEDEQGIELDDTWEWDGERWSEIADAGTPPLPRSRSAMTYDSARGACVLFGGLVSTSTDVFVSADTWEYDGSWRRITVASPPRARHSHAMTFDPRRQRTVLFGGDAISGRSRETWEFDGQTWTEVAIDPASPPPRALPAMAYDPERRRVVLFGGFSNDVVDPHLRDTWSFDGRRWTELTASGSAPPARRGHAMTYDSAGEVALLFGGAWGDAIAPNARGDTWAWNGSSWVEVAAEGQGPMPRRGAAIAYDVERDRTVLFGGERGVVFSPERFEDTWEWNAMSWVDVSTASPSARADHAMAYGGLGRVLLFGGGTAGGRADDLWSWDGTSWAPISAPGGPSPVLGHRMVFESARGRVAMFGGNGPRDDNWDLTSAGWTFVPPMGGPSARAFFGMAYDDLSDHSYVFGGDTPFGRADDTWVKTDHLWRELSLGPVRPPERTYTAMVFDTAREEVVLFGGQSNNLDFGDTWLLDLHAGHRPAAIVSIDLAVALLPGDRILGLEVDAVAGAEGASIEGAQILAWDAWAGSWRSLSATNAAPSSAPAALRTSLGLEAEHLETIDEQIHLAVAPRAGFGSGEVEPAVAVDGVEVTVTYRR